MNVPAIMRDVTLPSAGRPPIAARCFSMISSAVCAAAAWAEPTSRAATATNRTNLQLRLDTQGADDTPTVPFKGKDPAPASRRPAPAPKSELDDLLER